MAPIRCGVVGLRHGMACTLEVLKEPAFELVALASGTREAYDYLCGETVPGHLDTVSFTAAREELIAQCRARRDFREVAFYSDYEQLLRHPGLDAIILAPPVHLNAPFAIQALEAGKHVLAAKPFARTLEEGERLRQAVRAAPGKFMLGFEFRHAPLTARITDELAAGRIGELRLLWWNLFRMPFRAGYRARERSGGAFVAEICHWFDLFHHLNGRSPFARVAAFGGLDVHREIQDFEDNAVCIVEYANSVRGSINFTYFTDQPQHNVFGLVGTDGKITGDTDAAGQFVMYSGPGRHRTSFRVDPATAHCGHLGFDVLHRRFAEAIARDLRVNEEEAERGFENLMTTLAARSALEQGAIVGRDALAD